MIRLLALCAATAAFACAADAPQRAGAPAPVPATPAQAAAPRQIDVPNAGFEAGMKDANRCALRWDCTMHSNPDAFRFSLTAKDAASGRSLCVERMADEPWALVTQAFDNPALRGKRVRLSMAVRVEAATGNGAGPWLLAQGRPPAHAQTLVNGTRPWERVSVELAVPPNATTVEIGAIIEGPGKACFDDVRLEALPG